MAPALPMAHKILPDLATLQRHFRAAVLGDADEPVIEYIRAAHGPASGRIAVYRNTVQASLVDVLATAFPVTRRVVGEAFFANLAARFIRLAPPRLAHLSAFGGDLADFIAGEDVGRRLAYLADVTRLEWARGCAYFAADTKPLDPARLAAMSPDDLEQTILVLHPATRLVESAFPIHRIWEVNQPEIVEIPRLDLALGQAALVSRRGHHIMTRALAAADAALIGAFAAGKAMGEAAATALATDDAFDLQQALQDHFINGTFQDELIAAARQGPII